MGWLVLPIAVGVVLVLIVAWTRSAASKREALDLFELSPVSMAIVDSDGIVRTNKRLASLCSRDCVPGGSQRLDDLLHPESVTETLRLTRSVLESGHRIEVADTSLVGKGGEVVQCDVVASPTRFERHPAVLMAFTPVDQKQAARDALHQSEERFRRFFSELPVPAYRTSLEGTIIEGNQALLDLLEVKDGQLINGVNAKDFYADPDERRADDRSTRNEAAVEDRILRLRSSTGRDIRVRDVNRVVEGPTGPIFEGVAIDVTQELRFLEEMERRERQQAALAEVARTALRDSDVGHAIGEAVRRVGAALGADCTLIAQPHGGRGLLATSVAYGTDSVREREAVHEYVLARLNDVIDGDSPVEMQADETGEGVGLAGMIAALTGPVGTFGVIAVAGRGFVPSQEDRDFLTAVAATLGAAVARGHDRERMGQLMRSKDEFIASVSHELRTPLTVVVGLALELEQNWQMFSEGELAEFISLIAGESREMGNLIEDLLVAARADIGQVPIYPEIVELRNSVDQVIDSCSLVDRARISTAGEGVFGLADPVRFRQVVRNLVTNAIRYGGPRIYVEVTEEDGEALVSVSDDGSGIPEADREKIFAAYERSDSSEKVPGSVGLGLTVSRKLIELMGGSISYRYDRGSHFEMRLPAVRAAIRAD
jgi:PAS domain S-box-containing protein